MSDPPVINVSSADQPVTPHERTGVFRRTDRSAQSFVSSMRNIDLSNESDAELRARAAGLKHVTPDDDTQAECFAVIDETIRRRIGAWQVFDTEIEHPDIDHFREPADALVGTDKLIAETLAFVSDESASRYFADIDLPSEFYNAMGKSSLADALRFEPTDEQVEAGRLMLDHTVVEMDAGEGKTVAAAFPAVTWALSWAQSSCDYRQRLPRPSRCRAAGPGVRVPGPDRGYGAEPHERRRTPQQPTGTTLCTAPFARSASTT